MPLADPSPHQTALALYVEHHGWLKGWLRRRLGCSEQAADLAHDTFLRILGTDGSAVAPDEPRAYLTVIARRLLVDRSRRQRIEQTYLAELAAMTGMLDRAPPPESVVLALRALERLGDALAALPAKGREAFLLHYLDGETQPVIATRLRISLRMTQKYLARALLACHRALDA